MLVIEEIGAGLHAGTNPRLPGLLVVAPTADEVRRRAPAAMRQLRSANRARRVGRPVWDVLCAACGRTHMDPGGPDADWTCQGCDAPIRRPE